MEATPHLSTALPDRFRWHPDSQDPSPATSAPDSGPASGAACSSVQVPAEAAARVLNAARVTVTPGPASRLQLSSELKVIS